MNPSIVGLTQMAIALTAVAQDATPEPKVGDFFLVYSDSCILRLGHIESIKYYREMLTQLP